MILPLQVHVLVLISNHLQRLQHRREVLRDVGVEMLQDFEAVDVSLVGEFHDGLDESEVDVEGLAVLEVAVAEVVDQLEAEGALGGEGGAVAVEQQKAEVEVYQVGLLSQVLLNEGNSLLQVPYSKLFMGVLIVALHEVAGEDQQHWYQLGVVGVAGPLGLLREVELF